MAVKEKRRKGEGQIKNTLGKLKEHQEDWEAEENLQNFLRFVRGEDVPDSLKKSIREEMGKP